MLIEEVTHDQTSVQDMAHEFLSKLKLDIESVAELFSTMSGHPLLTKEQLLDTAMIGYNYLLNQKDTRNWDQKLNQAWSLIRTARFDLVNRKK